MPPAPARRSERAPYRTPWPARQNDVRASELPAVQAPGTRARAMIDAEIEVAAAAPAVASGKSPFSIAVGDTVVATLMTPIRWTGGSATTFAEVIEGSKLPKGTRLIGTVGGSAGEQVSLRFQRLALPDGREARFLAEAQDTDGSIGLVAETSGAEREESSRVGDLAQGAASEVTAGLIGGMAGRLAGDAVRDRRQGRVPPRRRSLSLSRGTRLRLLIVEATQSFEAR